MLHSNVVQTVWKQSVIILFYIHFSAYFFKLSVEWLVQISFPPPNSYIINVSFSAHVCMMHNATYFLYDGKFSQLLRQLLAITVWDKLCCDCQGKESPLKVVLHWRLSSTEGCFPPKVIIGQSSSSAKGRLPPKVVLHQPYHLGWSYIVRTVNVPNFSFLPCLEVA